MPLMTPSFAGFVLHEYLDGFHCEWVVYTAFVAHYVNVKLEFPFDLFDYVYLIYFAFLHTVYLI